MQAGNTGSHDEPLKTLDAEAIEAATLVSSVEDRLANLNDVTKDADDDEPADDDQPTPEDQAGEDEESTPSDSDEGDTKDGEKELPPAFLRAAVHRGWKEDEAVEFFKTSPDAALKTFQNCYLDVNNASKEWAMLGKAKMQNLGVTDGQPPQQPEFKGVDVDKLKDEYDLDDKTVEILKAQNKQLEDVLKERNAQPKPQPQQQAHDPNIELQIENFFGSDSLKDYKEFYGEVKIGQNWEDLGRGQRDNRWRVIEQANLIAVGMEAMGQKVDLLDVLERAHMMVSEPVRERVVRERIKSDVQKRSNSITVKPSDGSRSKNKVAADAGGESKPRNRAELIESTQSKLDHLFSN